MVLRQAHGSAGTWSPGGQAEGEGSAGTERSSASGAGQLRGLLPLLPGYLGRVFAREIFPVNSEGGRSQAPGNRLTFPGCPGQNEPAWAPSSRPAPALKGAFCLGVCVECFYVLAPRRSGFPPLACPPEAPRRSLPFRLRGPEAGVGDANGAGWPSPGR